MNQNPYQSADPPLPESKLDGAATYNIVSDLVIGVNTRKADNRLQAKIIGISVVIAACGGVLLAFVQSFPWLAGAVVGAFVGLVGGLLGSGIYLMVYRGVRHIQGKHD